MELSSPRFKSLAVTAGLSFWFLIITFSLNIFHLEYFAIFIISILLITQIFSVKLSKGLDIFAIFNTKIFLGLFFVSLISIYGIIFRFLKERSRLIILFFKNIFSRRAYNKISVSFIMIEEINLDQKKL